MCNCASSLEYKYYLPPTNIILIKESDMPSMGMAIGILNDFVRKIGERWV